jgi:hypothetical protein
MELTATLTTGSGMHLVWDRVHFAGVRDYPSWERELLDDQDIKRHISAGHVVPVNIQSDGAFVISVRADVGLLPGLHPQEKGHVVAVSGSYRFECLGHVDVSGIEYVTDEPSPPLVASGGLQNGTYQATVHLLDWYDLPVRDESNPDFVVLIGPYDGGVFRQSVTTFEGP